MDAEEVDVDEWFEVKFNQTHLVLSISLSWVFLGSETKARRGRQGALLQHFRNPCSL